MKRKLAAAILILATTAIAAIVACQQALPARKLGGSLDYAPSGAAPLTTFCNVPTPCLSNINTNGMAMGSMAFVYKTKAWYYLDPSSTATADNSATIAALAPVVGDASGTTGNWVLIQPSIGGGMQDGAGAGNETIININTDAGTTVSGAGAVNNLIVLTGTITANFQLTLPNNVGQCWYIDTSNVTWTGGFPVVVTTGSDAAGYSTIKSGDAGGNVFQKTLFAACVTEPNVVTLM